MTLNQLLSEAYALGFEENGEADELFFFAVNRALRLMATEIMPTKAKTLTVTKPDLIYRLDSYEHSGGKNFEVIFDGAKAYSFRTSGNGEFIVFDNLGGHSKAFSGAYCETRGLLSGSGKIIFTGDSAYTVSDLSVFASLSGSGISSVPLVGAARDLKITDYADDFLSAVSAPTDKDGAPLASVSIMGEVMRVPFDFSGDVTLYYKPLPKKLGIDDLHYTIEIPRIFEHLLPILTASYIWLDDDAEKADYYMNLYKDELSRLKRSVGKSYNLPYIDTTGWA